MRVLPWLVLLIAIVIPSAGSAEPPFPPHQFYGHHASGSGAQIDGIPVSDGVLVEALNEDDSVVARSTIRDGLWVIEIDPARASEVRFALDGQPASERFAIQSAHATSVSLRIETHRAYPAGWSAFVHTGAPTTASALAATIPGVSRLLRWDATTRAWDAYLPFLDRALSSLTSIERGDVIWVYIDDPAL